MAKSRRKQISQTLRFEVFKRDQFTCQYCGSHPPGVILHVDHIVAVAKGGTNDEENLVTSCSSCNQGKGVRSLSAIPQSLDERAADVAGRERQLLGYTTIMDASRKRIEDEVWEVARHLDLVDVEGSMPVEQFRSIKVFIEKLGKHQVLDAAEIAIARGPASGSRLFLYFCGVCRNMIDPERQERRACA